MQNTAAKRNATVSLFHPDIAAFSLSWDEWDAEVGGEEAHEAGQAEAGVDSRAQT